MEHYGHKDSNLCSSSETRGPRIVPAVLISINFHPKKCEDNGKVKIRQQTLSPRDLLMKFKAQDRSDTMSGWKQEIFRWRNFSESIRLPFRRQQTMLTQICFILSLSLLTLTKEAAADKEELCETLPSEIHIIKEEFDELGRLQRTCNGEISVNKCEGACNSQVQPSVITPTGFLKECYCCRESFLRERIITLTHCYDPDGMRLTRDENKSMDIKLKEPNDCKCSKCGDFSR